MDPKGHEFCCFVFNLATMKEKLTDLSQKFINDMNIIEPKFSNYNKSFTSQFNKLIPMFKYGPDQISSFIQSVRFHHIF